MPSKFKAQDRYIITREIEAILFRRDGSKKTSSMVAKEVADKLGLDVSGHVVGQICRSMGWQTAKEVRESQREKTMREIETLRSQVEALNKRLNSMTAEIGKLVQTTDMRIATLRQSRENDLADLAEQRKNGD